MKCALHVHTDLSDGYMSLAEAIRSYAELGFGCVAITDHEFLLRNNYLEMIEAAAHFGMTVLCGVEMDFKPWAYQHVLRIRGEAESLHVICHPSAYYLTVDEVRQRIESGLLPIDAVETTYRGLYAAQYDTPDIGVPKIATDDSHHPSECGLAWIETEYTRDKDALIRAVRAGEFENVFRC